MHRLFLLAFITFVSANTCEDATPVYDFNFSSYGQGIWYEFARYSHPLLDDNSQCTINNFTLNGNTISTKTTYIINNKEFVVQTIIKFTPDVAKAGKMTYDIVKVQGVDTPNTTLRFGEDTILAVDYDNYVIMQSCQYDEATKKPKEYGWILSRSKNPSEKIRSEIENFIKNSTVLDSSKFLYIRFDDDACRIDP